MDYPDGTKFCNGCKETKQLADFVVITWGKRIGKPRSRCSKCETAYTVAYQRAHPKSTKIWRKREYDKYRDRYLTQALRRAMRSWGCSEAEVLTYITQYKTHSGLCDICKEPEQKQRLALDHDHVTNRPRGFLCRRCNQGLGFFRDDITIMAKAISYIQDHTHQKPTQAW